MNGPRSRNGGRHLRQALLIEEVGVGVLRSGRLRPLEGNPPCDGSSACSGCPLTPAGASGPWPRTVVLSRQDGRGYCVLVARRQRRGGLLIQQWRLASALLPKLIRARVEELAARSALTSRERQTFDMILMGRTSREIAEALGVSVRTVKFHQANLLQKLGADSRFDLLRVIL